MAHPFRWAESGGSTNRNRNLTNSVSSERYLLRFGSRQTTSHEYQIYTNRGGIDAPIILEKPDVYVSYLTPTWITALHQFLYTHNIEITLTDTLRIVYSGKSDQCIMNVEFLQQYTIQQQRDINLVRHHLQAITLSDISDPDRNTIRIQALCGHREAHQRLRQNWPRQDEPTSSQQKLWTRYISSNFIRYDWHWRQALGDTRPTQQPWSPWLPTIQPIMGDSNPVLLTAATRPSIILVSAAPLAQTTFIQLPTGRDQPLSLESLSLPTTSHHCV
jgi:hypothetical protein